MFILTGSYYRVLAALRDSFRPVDRSPRPRTLRV